MSKTMEKRQEGVKHAAHVIVDSFITQIELWSSVTTGGRVRGQWMNIILLLCEKKFHFFYQFVASFSIPVSLRTELYCPHFFSDALLKGILSNAQKICF
jgi:hypothetical protein